MGISNFDIVQANQFIGPGIGSSGSSSEEQRDTGAVFSGAIRNMSSNGMILNEGQIEFVTNADRTGSIKFELFYIPLTDGATVVAA